MLFILETSNPEQTDTSMTNTDDISELPSACDQSTQKNYVLDLTKKPSKEEVFEEERKTLQSHSQKETDA